MISRRTSRDLEPGSGQASTRGVGSERRPARCAATGSRRLLLLLSVALSLAATTGVTCAQDTPEMLAAMRALLPPVPDEVPTFESLPPELRSQIPPLRFEGHRWHADAAQRFVQIDGRRINEDGVAGQELWVRQVRRDSVVMQFRSTLFEQPLHRAATESRHTE